MNKVYQLYYWPIQGRGEFVRLALEAAGADYVEVTRQPESEGGGVPAMMRLLKGADVNHPPFAPPILVSGDMIIAQTANILAFLGSRHRLAPADEAGRVWTLQLQLTIADLVVEAHDAHHPIGSTFYYEEQKPESLRRAADFRKTRLPKFLSYFETVISRNSAGGGHLVGDTLTYADLSLFHLVAGLRYAFPRSMERLKPLYAAVDRLCRVVGEFPAISAYLTSPRRLPFDQVGIFRHYPELDD